MNIAINMVPFGPESYISFIAQQLAGIATSDPENNLTILTTKENRIEEKGSNVLQILTEFKSGTSILDEYKYQKKTGRLLTDQKVELLFSPILIKKRFYKGRQILLIPHLAFENDVSSFSKKQISFYKKYLKKYIIKSELIVTSANNWKNVLIDLFNKKASNIFVFNDIIETKKEHINEESVKKKYTNGDNYFIVLNNELESESFIQTLKAFSLFKKRLRSNMKIVFIHSLFDNIQFQEILKTYKYKEDVFLISNKSSSIQGGYFSEAYAVIYNAKFTGFETYLAQIVNGNTILIGLDNPSNNLKDYFGESGVYYNENDTSSLAERLLVIYKEEEKRAEIIGRQKAAFKNNEDNFSYTLLEDIIKIAVN